MTPRAFEAGRDYPEICEWWRAHKWRYVPLSSLAPLGIVIEDQTHKYCAGWIYFAQSNWAWFEWIVSNPSSPIKKRKTSLELLLNTLLDLAKSAQVETVLSSVKNENLSDLYQSCGFIKGDTGMTNLIARLSP